jgi:hypothetical protein
MAENEKVLKRMSPGDCIDYSIEVYKRNFKNLTIISLMFYVPFSLVFSLFSNYLTEKLARANSSLYFRNDTSETVLATLAFLLVYLFYFMTINAVMSGAVSKIVYDDVVYQRINNLKKVIGANFKKFPSLLGYKFLQYLILLGVFIGSSILFVLVFVIFSAFAGAFTNMAMRMGTIYGVVLLAFINIIVILILLFSALAFVAFFYIKFSFGVQAIAIENKSASEGLSRSIQLSRGNYWKSFWALFFGLILYFSIPLLLQSLLELLSFLDVQLYEDIYLVATTLVQIIHAVFLPFIITLITVVYINMKVVNEGLDLEVKVDKLLEMQKDENDRNDGEVVNV